MLLSELLLDKLHLSAEVVNRVENAGYVHINGYLPYKYVEKGAIDWKEFLHPRDRTGKFRSKVGGMRHALDGIDVGDFDVQAYWDHVPPQKPDEPDFVFQARALSGLPPKVKHEALAVIRERTGVCQYLAQAKTAWYHDHNLPQPKVDWDTVEASYDKAGRIVDAIAQLHRDDGNPEYKAAYDDFKRQTEEMWNLLTGDPPPGLGVTVEKWDERKGNGDDPYLSADDQLRDLVLNHHLWINRGEFFIGSNPDSPTGSNHPWMSPDEYWRFRAVHDAFGHSSIGSAFDRHGEYAAWMSHSSMYTGLGRKAMSTEYHAINSYLWYTGTPLPPDKWGVLLPDELIQTPFDSEGNVVRKSPKFISADARDKAAGEGKALPDGSFPIRNKDELRRAIMAIGRAKNPDAARAHIIRRARALGATDMLPDSWSVSKREHSKHNRAWYLTHPNPKSSPKDIAGHHGHHPHGPSILWPALYEHLRAKGKTKAAAAAISNAAWKKRKMGLKTNTPTSARGLAKSVAPDLQFDWDTIQFLMKNNDH